MSFAGQDSGDGPVAFIVPIVGAIVVGLALVVEASYQPPVWLHRSSGCRWLWPSAWPCPFKGTMIALQLEHRRQDFGAGG